MSVLSPPGAPALACTRLHGTDEICVGGSLAPSLVGPPARLEARLVAHIALVLNSHPDEGRLLAVLDRMGLRGHPPVSLAEAGRRAGLSGERIRQLERRLRALFDQPRRPRPPPLLEVALATVARAVPLPASAVGGLLRDSGVAAGPFSAASLVCAAELYRLALPFALAGAGVEAVLLPKSAAVAAAHSDMIECRARRLVERCGATTTAVLVSDLGDRGIAVCPLQLKVVVEASKAIVDYGDGWFSFVTTAEGTFVRASRRMLAVTSPLSVESLRDGLRRHNAFRRLPPPPPATVLAAVYRDLDGFAEVDGLVWSVDPVDESVIGLVNRTMLAILRSAPQAVMSRSAFHDACHRAGLNLTTVNLYTTYSECIERVGPGLVAPRGTRVPPELTTAGLGRPAGRRKEDGPIAGRTAEGRPWLAWRVSASTWANGVVHVPAALRPLIEGRRFRCRGLDGTPVTTLGVDLRGNCWGWTGFLRRAGVPPGRIVRATFDTARNTAVLEVIDCLPASAV